MSIFWTDVLVCKHPLLPLSWACWILVIYLFFSPLHSCFVVSFRPFLSLTVPVLSRLHQMSGILKETVWTSRTVSRAGNLTSWEAALLGLEANSHGLLHPDLITVLIPVMLLQAGRDATTVSATVLIAAGPWSHLCWMDHTWCHSSRQSNGAAEGNFSLCQQETGEAG